MSCARLAASCRRGAPGHTYIDIVVELDAPRAVELDLLQGLAHNVVGLVLRLLRRLDDGRFVKVALVVDVELAEGILQPEDLALLELRVLPALLPSASQDGLIARSSVERRGAYFCSLMTFMAAGVVWGVVLEGRGEEKSRDEKGGQI